MSRGALALGIIAGVLEREGFPRAEPLLVLCRDPDSGELVVVIGGHHDLSDARMTCRDALATLYGHLLRPSRYVIRVPPWIAETPPP